MFAVKVKANWSNEVTNFNYTGTAQTYTAPADGYYKLEVWGAQGGGKNVDSSLDAGQGGLGGYSIGTARLFRSSRLYVYVGGAGEGSGGLARGGFNGGGSAFGKEVGEPGNGGGGASDIRIGQDSLYSRVIVAGGGGGGGEDSSENGGYGGGTTGGSGIGGHSCGHGGYGGTTTSGGQLNGSFGMGAHTSEGGAGGGGWYGGGNGCVSVTTPLSSAGNDSTDNNSGGGGSGYVYTASTASSYPSGCLLNSSYYLSNASTTGNVNSGNGKAKITYVGSTL